MDTHDIPNFLLVLAALLATAKLLGAFAQRLGQPAVLGELIAGVILGRSVLGLLDPADPVFQVLAELGVIVLLFEIGLHTDLRSMRRVAVPAVTVGVVGVVIPFALGYVAASSILGLNSVAALVCGAALTATSIGISARVLSDLGLLESNEGQVVLGAAVLDDIIGLIVLSVVAGIVVGGEWTLAGVAMTSVLAIGFIVVALVAGRFFARPVFTSLEGIRAPGTLTIVALAFAFLLSALAAKFGSAMILGAFAAGIILNRTAERAEIERSTTTIGYLLVPIFFASVGAAVDIRSFGEAKTLVAGGLLILVGVLGKFAAAYAPWNFRGNRRLVGVAMIPRGEVGLIFAQMGLATRAIDQSLFSALALMVLVTTLMAPPLLTLIAQRPEGTTPVDDTGIDNLVSGDWAHRTPRSVPRPPLDEKE